MTPLPANPPSGAEINAQLELFQIFNEGTYLSVKHDSYFQVYEELLRPYVGKPITFVEVGIFHGGSLFMWRKFLGPEARIIGIDLNPDAKRWEAHGFEIHIGDQADPAFWDRFYAQVGPVDVLLDDGGHMNHQQIVTTDKAIDHLNDGGLLIVEDVHASYLSEFHNPSEYSFINFARKMVDSINARFPAVQYVGKNYGRRVYSTAFYESIVAFRIDSRRCFSSSWSTNNGIQNDARDFRHDGVVKNAVF
ncbi:class I SAM-dependent methyltransferase [Variovorax boronicumulans]|uniref:class I SAM-dependent methyltransferase n=1 Tax=Variovorax boronicumulans TaxID=436515 RepID=UPI003394D650